MKIRKPIQQGTALVPCRTKGENSFKKIGSIAGKVLLALLLILLLLAVFGTAAHAAGLVDDTVDAANEYSKYPLDNYQLDFYVDSGWDWLPWNWLDGIGKQVMYGLYFTPDITISSQDESNSIDKSISEKISDISGVESVFGMMYSTEYPTEINGNVSTIDLFSHEDAMMDSFKKSVVSGNISKVYGNSQYVMAVYSDQTGLNVGDKIKIGTEELEVACVVSEGVGSVSGSAVVVCSEETYTRLMGEQGYAMLSVVLEKDVSDTAVNKIYELSEGNVVADSRAQNDEVNGSYWVFRIAAYGFLAIISLITILNIMNSVSMGVSARIKQYGAMRAVGMESRQVTKMITAEAATYAICGTTVGIILGLLLHYLIYTKIVITHFRRIAAMGISLLL